MKSFKSVNFWTQVVTLFLSAFVIGGLNVNASELSLDLVKAVANDNYWSLVSIIVINVANPVWQWIKTLKKNPGQFWAFLHSVNWWVSVANISFASLLIIGVEIPEGVGEEIIKLIFEGQYWDAIPILFINIIIPVVKFFVKKKPIEIQ